MAFTPLNALNEFLAVARRRSFAGVWCHEDIEALGAELIDRVK